MGKPVINNYFLADYNSGAVVLTEKTNSTLCSVENGILSHFTGISTNPGLDSETNLTMQERIDTVTRRANTDGGWDDCGGPDTRWGGDTGKIWNGLKKRISAFNKISEPSKVEVTPAFLDQYFKPIIADTPWMKFVVKKQEGILNKILFVPCLIATIAEIPLRCIATTFASLCNGLRSDKDLAAYYKFRLYLNAYSPLHAGIFLTFNRALLRRS